MGAPLYLIQISTVIPTESPKQMCDTAGRTNGGGCGFKVPKDVGDQHRVPERLHNQTWSWGTGAALASRREEKKVGSSGGPGKRYTEKTEFLVITVFFSPKC